ncbi:MAG: hypothetical protein M3Q99_08420 [Acidobacteriota bacterium]|nr:hypothetical protein [Acidobacteriota bacterium]
MNKAKHFSSPFGDSADRDVRAPTLLRLYFFSSIFGRRTLPMTRVIKRLGANVPRTVPT